MRMRTSERGRLAVTLNMFKQQRETQLNLNCEMWERLKFTVTQIQYIGNSVQIGGI